MHHKKTYENRARQVEPNTPVLVGVGQYVERQQSADGCSPAALIARSAQLALEDASAKQPLQPQAIAMVRLVFDTQASGDKQLTQYANPPAAVARRLGLKAARYFYNEGGGSSPQSLVNAMAEMIAGGELNSVLIVGGEALATQHACHLSGKQGWEDGNDDDVSPEMIGTVRAGLTHNEATHGLAPPINAYPLYANGLRRKYGQNVQQHLRACAELFSRFSEVAAANPYSWFTDRHSPEEIATVNESNRWIGLPYPKYLNAIMRVNMAASVLMCSWQEAEQMGIARDKRIFLHGCSQANERWNLSERVDYESAPAIGLNVRQAMDMAGVGVDDLSFMDIYSCFPSAVQAGCDAIGLAHDDARGLTVSGGLPYFGGAGNNYTMHAIAKTVQQLRQKPNDIALVTANGWYLTKHASGIYSGRPQLGPWQAPDYASVQMEVEAMPAPPLDEKAEGTVTVETYTVVCGRGGPQRGIVIARTADGRRTLANVPEANQGLLQSMMAEEWLDRPGHIQRQKDRSTFARA